MIPVKLKIRNFMPYRGDMPPLSFNGIHTACICGDNGNGKSSLVDAITWVIWGKSRTSGTKVSDDELIHHGETEMEVELDFSVGGQLYRVIRKHSKPKGRRSSGQSSLDLFIADNNTFKPISGDTKILTQQKIIDILNMDYDTFINSAFLRQGHADEFTKQSPSKRKEVLANILGLSLYDRLEERAKELSKQQHIETTQLESSIQEIEHELAHKPEVEAALNDALNQLSHLEKEIEERWAVLDRLRQQRESLESKKSQLAQLEEHITATRKELERREGEIKQHDSRITDYEKVISQREDIEDGYQRFVQKKNLNEELNHKLQLLYRIKDRKSQLEKSIQEAQSKLLTEHALVQSRVEQMENSSQRLPQLKKEKAELDSEQIRLKQSNEELERKRKQSQNAQSKFHELETKKERLEQEIKEIEEKLELLNTQDSAKCPLCETEIGQDGLGIIRKKYTDDKEGKTASLQSLKAEIDKKKFELHEIKQGVQALETSLNKELASMQGRAGIISQAISEAEASAVKLKDERNLLADIEKRLSSKDFARQEQLALNELENELASLQYKPSQHQKTTHELAALEKYEQSKRGLEEAEKLIAWEKEQAVKTSEAAREINRRLENDSQKKQKLLSELDSLPNLEGNLKQAEAGYRELNEKQKQAQQTSGSLKGRLEHLLKQEIKIHEKKGLLEKISKDIRIYRDLIQAFGKKGIQAMLIEMSLPDIEAEANRLLGRMTDNSMHIRIETQRQSKKDEPIETLDIIISDELGPRPYETFSGGEAFRIDFAIRIALSKLLAKRAGAPLPTLIIDEGFGTQDSTGLEKVKEAINSIQDDFDKIIVITHIEELKDAFPTRINVVKTDQGSTLEVS